MTTSDSADRTSKTTFTSPTLIADSVFHPWGFPTNNPVSCACPENGESLAFAKAHLAFRELRADRFHAALDEVIQEVKDRKDSNHGDSATGKDDAQNPLFHRPSKSN